ncbi:UNVERIFIED_CONTAM: hypothetical protein Slati_0407000 [Sesamum latifolium]|uniref:DUF4283 domain-containing protein n=1 Tax=Sesamum latifolium TaxID=2727402 RepID=A0AAW2XUM3_9LAMI
MLNPVKGMEMRRLEEGRFLIRFNHIIDRSRALEGCPWSFEKNTMILSGLGANENPLNVDLDWCEFFVHVHDLPLSKMNFGVASLIGNAIGKFRDMEMDESSRSWGGSLRIRPTPSDSLASYVPVTCRNAVGTGALSEPELGDCIVEETAGGSHVVLLALTSQPTDAPMEMEAQLVPVPILFTAGTRGLMARRGRRRKRGVRRGMVIRKRDRASVRMEEGLIRDTKRRHLLDEESDVLSAEVAQQPRRSP